jgi:DNA-binding MarR family transcriptional regulator
MTQLSIAGFADRLNEILPVLFKSFAQRQANELYKGKITLPQFLVLDHLSRKGKTMMTEIANFMKVTTAATTGIIDRLVRYSYVTREHDPGDRRIINIKLTNKGIDLVNKVNGQRREMIIKIFGEISQADREEYLRILSQIKNILVGQNHKQA